MHKSCSYSQGLKLHYHFLMWVLLRILHAVSLEVKHKGSWTESGKKSKWWRRGEWERASSVNLVTVKSQDILTEALHSPVSFLYCPTPSFIWAQDKFVMSPLSCLSTVLSFYVKLSELPHSPFSIQLSANFRNCWICHMVSGLPAWCPSTTWKIQMTNDLSQHYMPCLSENRMIINSDLCEAMSFKLKHSLMERGRVFTRARKLLKLRRSTALSPKSCQQ